MLWKDDGLLDTWPKKTVIPNYNPNQMEIKFFWPLTEQISLDLDYSECCKPITSIGANPLTSGSIVLASTGTGVSWSTVVNAEGITTEGLTLKLDKRPNFVVRYIYKLLKIEWKLK